MGEIKIEMVTERKILDVSHPLFRGQPDRVYVDVCVKCAAVVFDPVAHDDWHRGGETDEG